MGLGNHLHNRGGGCTDFLPADLLDEAIGAVGDGVYTSERSTVHFSEESGGSEEGIGRVEEKADALEEPACTPEKPADTPEISADAYEELADGVEEPVDGLEWQTGGCEKSVRAVEKSFVALEDRADVTENMKTLAAASACLLVQAFGTNASTARSNEQRSTAESSAVVDRRYSKKEGNFFLRKALTPQLMVCYLLRRHYALSQVRLS